MEQVHCGIWEIGLFEVYVTTKIQAYISAMSRQIVWNIVVYYIYTQYNTGHYNMVMRNVHWV